MASNTAVSSISRYIAAARRAPRLERADELSLAFRWRREGDQAAADALVRAHLRDVVAIALSYRRYGIPLGELIAEGNFGMVQALAKFEPERGIRFATYAGYWIRAYVLERVLKSVSLVATGSGALHSRMFFRLRRERRRMTALLGEGEATERAIAERVGVPAEKVRALLDRLDGRDVSLDTPAFDGAPQRRVDLLPASDDQEQTLVEQQTRRGVKSAVERAVARLDPRERYIAEQRLMADPEEELSLAEIGRELGVSRERARQLETRTKRKLRAGILATAGERVNEWLERASPFAAPAA